MLSTRVALCCLLAWSCYGDASGPARASPLALYVPQMAVPKVPQVNAPRSPVPQMAVPSVPQVPQVPQVPKMQPMPEVQEVSEMPPMAEMPFEGVPSTVVDQLGRPYVLAQPIEDTPVSSLPFLSFYAGLGGGFAAGMTLVQAFLKKNGQKVSAKKLALGALSAATAAGIAFHSQAAHASVSVDQVGNLVATSSSDFGGSTIPLIGLGILTATIALLAGPVEE